MNEIRDSQIAGDKTAGRLDSESLVRNFFGNNQGANDSSTESLSQVLSNFAQIAREHKWWLLVFMVIGMVAGIFKAATETPVYEASLTMAVEPSNGTRGTQALFDPYAYRFYETQYELLKSRSVAARVVDSMELVDRDSVHKLLIPPSALRSLLGEFSRISGLQLIPQQETNANDAAVKEMNPAERERQRAWLTSVIQSGVSVQGGERTNLVTVKFRSINPTFAADVANSLVDAYIEQGLDSQLNRSQQTSRWLSQRIEELLKSLDDSQTRLQNFLVSENLLESNRLNQIADNELQALNSEYLSARANLDELAKRYGAKHPRIAEARSEMIAAKSRLDRKSRSLSSSRSKQIELDRLEREVKHNQELYDAFLAKFKEADLSSSGSQVTSARIVDRALPPGGPIYPQKQRIVMTWTFGGLFLGLLIVFLREQLDSRFKSPRIVEEKLGLPLMGVVQAMKEDIQGVERHYLENKRSVFAESINHIRTGVVYSNVDNPPKVILVTSSVQGEGKTTLASNLALSYAQLGRTLLIDADLRRPRIKHIVKNDLSRGLVDYVAGMADIKECIQVDEDEPHLFILSSGTTPPNPLELLSSQRFKAILTGLRTKFDHIIIDTAPVLPASDAVVLGSQSDALLMVIQSDRTTHHMARDAVKRLNASRVSVDGLVLTQAQIKKNNPYQYGGYYGYGAYAYVEDQEA